jgi:hypothetical protein
MDGETHDPPARPDQIAAEVMQRKVVMDSELAAQSQSAR